MILAWNAGEDLVRCVESVAPTMPPWARIVILDNGSTDGAPERVAASVPGVTVLRMGGNIGFAAAYNRGIRAVPEEYTVMLNPDTTVVRKGWVEALVEIADRRPRVAAVACKMVFAADPDRINSVGGMVYWWTGPVDVGFGERDAGQYGPDFVPFNSSGGAMLVRRRAFDAVNGFDDPTFLYVEDVDFCWRLRMLGWEIAFAPDAVVRHAFSFTFGAISARKVYLTHRNVLRAMLRDYAASTLLWAMPAYGMWTALKVVGALFVERSASLAAAPMRALGWNAIMLRDTVRTRRVIQASRTVGDREIRRAMGSRGFEPLASVELRRSIAHGHMSPGEP